MCEFEDGRRCADRFILVRILFCVIVGGRNGLVPFWYVFLHGLWPVFSDSKNVFNPIYFP